MSQTDTTHIAAHCFVRGEIQFDGPAVIGGRVEGAIAANDALEIAESGVVEGDIRGVLVDIHGTVKGNIFAAQACRLGATARVTGELRAANLAIAEGASFVGQVSVGTEVAAEIEPAGETQDEGAVIPAGNGAVNRMEILAEETEIEAAPTAAAAAPSMAGPSGPTVRIMPQAIQNTLNRSPKIIKAR